MAEPERNEHVFVVHIWTEPPGEGLRFRRGYIEHVASRERQYFAEFDEARAFVDGLAGEHTPSVAGYDAAMSSDNLKRGDHVSWKSSQGTVEGTVEKKLTAPTEIKGHHVAASRDNPEYLVKSDKTGAEAAHKPGSLKKD